LGDEGFGGVVLPGVVELLSLLEGQGAALGLLTGNIARGAALKMRHFGLDRFFAFGAYGDDHHDRDRLGPVALTRAREGAGLVFTGAETIVLGDTPRDISCGRRIGARVVCVATGGHGVEELRGEGADLVFDSFARPAACLEEIRALAFGEMD
jgi:phosphoglycolate phosphatase-like HAD superfamily hydrolase